MSKYTKRTTTPEVWAVIRASHPELVVYSSYSAPDGDRFGNPDKCKMFTEYGFKDSDVPIIGAETTWEKDLEYEYKRVNEQTEYWLCIAVDDLDS